MTRPYAAAASATALSLLLATTSLAQTYHDSSGTVVPAVVPVGGDGSGALFTSSNPAKVSGTFSATLSGFQPTPAYSYQSVTTSSTAYALPSGTTAVVYNTGSNPITIKLGSSGVSVTSGQADVVTAGGWMAFTVGSATYYAVVGNGGASTVVVSGGSGLPTGSGGGGGGGAGGTVAQGLPALPASAWPVSETIAGSVVSSSNPVPISFGSGVALPSFASPPTVNIGAAPTVSVTGTFWQSTQPVSAASLPLPTGAATATGLTTINSTLGSPFQAGGSIGNTSFGASATGSSGLTAIIQPDLQAGVSPTTATTTQVVALSGSKAIYVSSFDFNVLATASGAAGFSLEYGTGTNCGTGTTAITQTKNYPAGGGISRAARSAASSPSPPATRSAS